MVDYNVELMSEAELITAANAIFTAQEKDFEKIKSEKWYHTLFHAITLNQDGKKYAVRGINSLAKLQQLFMNIYVKNYRKSHEQLNLVIDAVTKNSEAIKKLYGMCVLKLEEQQGLETLDAQDAEILALFLGEYRDESGSVPDRVREYNRGVLNCINQKVPTGILDNHQIRRLKAPKVVFRCFMEQCAIDGTIDTQEWSDKIYDDLKDFEIGETSKSEIKESVKYEAEIAGVDYFLTKYSNENVGVSDFDFEVDIEGTINPREAAREAEKKELKRQLYVTKIDSALMELTFGFSSAAINDRFNFDVPIVTVDIAFDQEIKDDVTNGEIKLPFLRDSIKRTFDDNDLVHAFKLCITDEDLNDYKHYFLIGTMDGFFFFIKDKIAFVEYNAIKEVKQNASSVTVTAWRVDWFSENGEDVDGENEVVIEKDDENKIFLRPLRKGIEAVIKETGGYVADPEYKVEEIVGNYIQHICKGASSVPYMLKDYRYNNDKKFEKRLKNALAKYALKVREDEVIGFIDTSLFGNGRSGLLFSKHGIAYDDYAFEKIFSRYDEINKMTIRKGKELLLYGNFSERKDDSTIPCISNIYYDLSQLKECIEQIQYVI